ncbi:protein CHUP1, chloroplastic-like [Zingiber officinale]|uniref:protein CHUP1, chloroplastic-like n=1 Tax=Zingiber officinale TaxID=94328 RepID=UPI001C4C35C3|nr:protein CHUP1, chloroplastic-like [Zingiber officinale]
MTKIRMQQLDTATTPQISSSRIAFTGERPGGRPWKRQRRLRRGCSRLRACVSKELGSERSMTNPLVFRFGFALAISIAGFAVVYRRSRTRRLPSRPRSFSGAESPSVCKSAVIGLKELRLLNGVTTAFTKVVTSTSTITTSITTTRTTSSSFLFFEFDRKKSENQEDGAMQEEITKLRNQVWSLQENERGLELQLLEYYGMQEQEAAVRELENQIKINSVQAKLNSLKIESLLADNQKLRAQLIDYSRARGESDIPETEN